jgi:hypothetical protein
MMTMTWCLCSWIAALASFVLLAAVLSCEKARASSFNLFLAGLTVPDLVLNVSSGITFTINLVDPETAFTGSMGVARCDWQGEFRYALLQTRISLAPRVAGPCSMLAYIIFTVQGAPAGSFDGSKI